MIRQPELIFVLPWIVAPLCLRIITLFSPGSIVSLPEAICGLLYGAPQDLFVGFEILILFQLLELAKRRRESSFRILQTVLACSIFAIIHFYFFLDFVLFSKLGIRMDTDFLYFFGEIAPFVDSAKEIGLLYFFVLVGIVVASMAGFFRFFRKYSLLRSIKPSGAVLAVLGVVILPTRFFIPEDVAYFSKNAVFQLQVAVLDRSNAKSKRRSRLSEAELHSILPDSNIEQYQLVSPAYPILKDTQGFSGEKNFDVIIEEGERPHLIFLFLESFRAKDVGSLGSELGATPVFDRLSKEGVLFTNYYSPGAQTTRAVIASLFGIPPRFTKRAVQSADPAMPLIGIADKLKESGYRSAFFHNGSLEFEGKTAFFSQHGYSEIFGGDDIARAYPKAERSSWGLHDEHLMPFVVDWLKRKDEEQQASFLTVFTVTTHHPYEVPSDYTAPFFDVSRPDPIHPIFKQQKGTELYRKYLETIHYADHALEILVDLLKKEGLAENTILFIQADSSCPMGEHYRNFFGIRFIYEENLKVPLLILAPGRLEQPQRIDEVRSQIDLLATVMDIFRLRGLNHSVGTSLVRKTNGRPVYFSSPFELVYQGLRMGKDKFIYCLKQGSVQLYDLSKDPGERRNIAGNHIDKAKRYLRMTKSVHETFDRLYAGRNFAPPR